MRVLVTGAGGFLGRHAVAELRRRGHDVAAVVRRAGEPAGALAGTDLVEADLRRPASALREALRGADAVLHLAADPNGSFRAMFDSTVLGTQHLLDAVRDAAWEGRFVHVSTVSVYALNQVPRGGVVDEATPVEPEPHRRDRYAWTKILQERLVRRHLPEPVVVRPGAVYGRERPFPAQLGRRLGSAVVLLGASNVMPLNHVDNTASLLAACVEHPRAAGETLNAIDPRPPRQWRYLRHWLRAQDRPVTLLPVPRSALQAAGAGLVLGRRLTGGAVKPPRFLDPYQSLVYLRSLRYATGRPTAVLGWTPPVDFPEALRRTFG